MLTPHIRVVPYYPNHAAPTPTITKPTRTNTMATNHIITRPNRISPNATRHASTNLTRTSLTRSISFLLHFTRSAIDAYVPFLVLVAARPERLHHYDCARSRRPWRRAHVAPNIALRIQTIPSMISSRFPNV